MTRRSAHDVTAYVFIREEKNIGRRKKAKVHSRFKMAASDNVSVNDGQSWNSWAEGVGLGSSEKDEDTDSESVKCESDAMKLRKEDMELFGLCPAWDDFYLVVCEICNQVTKPQAFRNHLEQRHGSNAFSRSDRADPSLLHSNKASSSAAASSRPSSSTPDKLRRNHGNSSLSPVVRVERMLLQGKLLPGERKELPSPQQPPPITPGGAGLLAGPGPGVKKTGGQQRERKLLPCKDREYDPNKHCGVMVGDSGKPCTRSLTCKTHSLSLRRAVPGRKKNFDDLLLDHRAAKEAALSKAARPDVSKTLSPPSAPPASPAVAAANAASLSQAVAEAGKHAAATEGVGSKANSNLGHHRSPGGGASKPPKPSPSSAPKAVPAKSCKPAPSPVASCSGGLPDGQSMPGCSRSSTPGCATTTERRKPDHSNDPYVQHHPRPAAICTFGLRQLGNGLFLLDRRWDRTRSALRLALGSERTGHAPPLKKLCVESRPTPETSSEDPADPYNFACAVATTRDDGVATPQPSVVKNATKAAAHPKQPHRTKEPVSNGGVSPNHVAKKKKVVPVAISAAPISFPFRMGALSRLQVATGKEGNGSAVVMATAGEVLNGRVNSVHSVKFSRTPAVGLATLVGQLQCRTEDGDGPPGKVGVSKGVPKKGGVSPAAKSADRTSGGVTQRNHHHGTLAASELSNLKVPPVTAPNGLLTTSPYHTSGCTDHSVTPGARGPKNGSKPLPGKQVVTTDAGAKSPLTAYQFASQVQAQLVQTPPSLRFPLLLPSEDRRPRTPQLKVPGGSLPT